MKACFCSSMTRIYRLFALLGVVLILGGCSAIGQVLRPGMIPDTPVVDQDGHARHFFTDLVKGKVIAINFGYTSCTSVCPMQGQRFGELQNLLGSHLGQDIFLVTVTTDPVNDTPAKLKAWGAQFGAKPGWTLVTGNPTDIQQLLSVFNTKEYNRDGSKHLPLVVMLNEPRGLTKSDFSLGAAFWINRSLLTWRNLQVQPAPVTSNRR